MVEDKELNKALKSLSLKLKCGKILFTIITTLLSIIVAPILLLVLSGMVLLMYLILILYVICLPFNVAYTCVHDRYHIEEDGDTDVSD